MQIKMTNDAAIAEAGAFLETSITRIGIKLQDEWARVKEMFDLLWKPSTLIMKIESTVVAAIGGTR